MQGFDVSWSYWLLGTLVIGLGLVVFLYLGYYVPNLPARPPERSQRENFPAGIQTTSRGVPPVLTLSYIAMGIFIVGYTLYAWLAHVNY